jgi:hypothetical protein
VNSRVGQPLRSSFHEIDAAPEHAPTRHDVAKSGSRAVRPEPDAEPRGNEHLSGTKRQRSWNRHKRSITSPILKDNIRENAVSQYFSGAGLEIRPLPRLFFRFLGNNACDDAIAFSEFDGVSRPKPSF